MKKLVSSLLAFILTGAVMAQKTRASIGFELGIPLGDFGEAVGVGVGGTLGIEVPIGSNTAFIFQAGYISFLGKTFEMIDTTTLHKNSFTTDPTGSIPIQVGLKYYTQENQQGFYAGMLAGVHLFSVQVSELDDITYTIIEDTRTDTYFSAAPELGYILGSNFDIALRYQMVFAETQTVKYDAVTYAFSTETKSVMNSYLGLRLAYMFGRGTSHPGHHIRH